MGNRIKELRQELRMTQTRLSIELGVSQETVSAYERELHYPSFAQILVMSKLFHTSIDYIMGLSDVRDCTSFSQNKREENRELQKLLALAGHLNQNQLELVIAYAQGMVDGQV